MSDLETQSALADRLNSTLSTANENITNLGANLSQQTQVSNDFFAAFALEPKLAVELRKEMELRVERKLELPSLPCRGPILSTRIQLKLLRVVL